MFIFYAHGGSDNHGCEAIIRGTCENLKGKKILFSSNQRADLLYGLDKLVEVRPDAYKRYYHPVRWFVEKVYNTVTKRNSLFKLVDGKIQGVYLSVGGDNYCYPKLIYPVVSANHRIRSRKNKTILWGTSIESEVLDIPEVLKDIREYDYIFARESLTYNALVSHGLQDKSFLYPDPAFAMKSEFVTVDNRIFDKPVVGINISPLILKFDKQSEVIKEGYRKIIDHILEHTEANICLIPHVVKRNNDDRSAIGDLLKDKRCNRIYVMDDLPAQKLKYIISKCDFFIGARTHSTIAAYSSGVPTMVVGYSIKAQGIALDIFGSIKEYVVDVRTLEDSGVILDAFVNLYEKREQIRHFLQELMPEYISQTKDATDKLLELV